MPCTEFESPLPHDSYHLKPVPVAGFIIYNNSSAKSVSKIYHYRKPKIVKAKAGWYIEYYYRIPLDVRPLYEDKTWYRFRIKEDINRRKGRDREDYAEMLLGEITNSLKGGYNPFKPAKQLVASENSIDDQPAEINITDALGLFLEKWKAKGLEPLTYNKYERYITRLLDWLKRKKIPYTAATNITSDHIEMFLDDMKKDHGFGNREYNNHFDFIRTAFNYLLKKKIISESPCAGVDKQKTKPTKHRFFDPKSLDDITKAMKEKDPYTYIIFQTVYYLCVRSDKEIRSLKVENINWDQGTILTEEGKTGERHIPMDEHVKKLLKAFTKNAAGDHYIFGPLGVPSEIMSSHGLFSKKFAKVRDAIGMSNKFTLYGAKHTRVIHLKSDGVKDADIMNLTGHTTFEGYSKYLRDLGMTADIKNINAKGRKV